MPKQVWLSIQETSNSKKAIKIGNWYNVFIEYM